MREDPTFRVHTDPDTAQTLISGMGELHLDIITDRLIREFRVGANVGRPQVAYRETITVEATGEGRSCVSPAAGASTVTASCECGRSKATGWSSRTRPRAA